MTNPAEQFFGDTSKSAKFETVGETVGGPIVAIGEPRQQTEFRTDGQPGAPLVWPDGSPRMQLPVTVQTEQRDDHFDDGRRTFYIKGEMKKAVGAALKTAGAKMAVGGVLTITFSGEEPTKGFPKKLYTATYAPPTPGDGFFDQPATQAPPAQQAPQPAAQTDAAPQQMVQLTPEQYAAMQAAMANQQAQQQPAPQAPAAPQKASYEQYAQAMGFTPQNSEPPF